MQDDIHPHTQTMAFQIISDNMRDPAHHVGRVRLGAHLGVEPHDTLADETGRATLPGNSSGPDMSDCRSPCSDWTRSADACCFVAILFVFGFDETTEKYGVEPELVRVWLSSLPTSLVCAAFYARSHRAERPAA